MSIKKTFDLYEATILLEEMLVGKHEGISRIATAKRASEKLRSYGKAQGLEFGVEYRSPDGVAGRLRVLEAIYFNIEYKGSSATKIFEKAVLLKKYNKEEYLKILKFALGSIEIHDEREKEIMIIEQEQQKRFRSMSFLLRKVGLINKPLNQYTFKEEIDSLINEIKYNGRKYIHSKTLINSYLILLKEYASSLSKKNDDEVVEDISKIKDVTISNKKDTHEDQSISELKIDSIAYDTDKVEAYLKDADIEGRLLKDIVCSITGCERGITPVKNWLDDQIWAVEMPGKRYIHFDCIFEFEEAADQVLHILMRQFEMFGGYTNAETLSDAVRNELMMFLNDNDFCGKEEIYYLAKYLFEKKKYQNKQFYFYGGRHIYRDIPQSRAGDSAVLINFIRNSGGIASRDECMIFLKKLKMSYGNPNGLLGIGKKNTEVLIYDESYYVLVEEINITDVFKFQVMKALELILNDFPYIIPHQLSDSWFAKLPMLPKNLKWNLLVLQQIIDLYIPEYKTISAMEGQSFSTIKAGIVRKDSLIENCADLVHVMLIVDKKIKLPLRFSIEEFRGLLLDGGIIERRELYYVEQLKKAFTDRRYAWAADEASVLILEK